MVRKFIFIGQNGSMGYKRGKAYKVAVFGVKGIIILVTEKINSDTEHGLIPYDTFEEFDKNWLIPEW